jgi:acetyl esterase/lipase
MKRSTLLSFATIVAISPFVRAQTPTYPNLVYARLGGTPLMLDLYIPTTGTGPFPLAIHIHGGGWESGSRFPIPQTGARLLDAGFAVASVDYRLTSQAGQFGTFPVIFPAQIEDVKGSVRWLRAHAATYNLDSTRFGSFGESAGGHLSALLANSGGVAVLEGDVGGNLAYSSSVQVASDYFGPTDLLHTADDVTTPPGSTLDHDAPTSPESHLIGWDGPGQGVGDVKANLNNPNPPYPALVQLLAQVNPITWVDASDPPFFIAHGTSDTTVPLHQSTRLSVALNGAGVFNDYRALPGLPHAFQSIAADNAVVEFFQTKLVQPILPDPGAAFCPDDGTGTACPCGNATDVGGKMGCANSLVIGGRLSASGVASIAHDTLVLLGASMPNSSALYLQATLQAANGSGVVFGDGLRCLAGNSVRLGTKTNTAGFSTFPSGADPPVSVKGGDSAGATRYYQVLYRDPASFCTASTFNYTNGYAITWAP